MQGLFERALLRVARLALPRGDREWMAGDIEEEYARVRADRGRPAAARWLAGEAVRNAAHAARSGRSIFHRDPFMRGLRQDLRYAGRLMRRTPGVTATIVVTLALGIGANAVVFSVVNGLLLRPLPVDRPDRLVFVQGRSSPGQSYPNYVDLRDRTTTLDGLVAYRVAPMSVDSTRRWGYLASGNYFDVLGVRPIAGRFFHAEDDRHPGAAPVAVLSYDEWVDRYARDPRAIGSTIRINQFPYTIIGVAPPGFFGTERFYRPAMWIPMMMQAQIEAGNPWLDRRQTFNVWLVARLRVGVLPAQAQADLNAVAAQLARDYPWPNEGMSLRLTEPGLVGTVLGTPVRAFTFGVQALAALVLLAACANLASLLSARGSDRRREMGIRIAIGAARGRLVRQLLTESLLLALAGGLAGAALAWTLARALSAWHAPIDAPVQFDVTVDWRVLLFACLVSTAAGIVFGVAPAAQGARADPNAALKGYAGDRGTSRRWWSLREGLVMVQMVLCFVVICACLLSARGLQQALTMPLGFEPQPVAVAAFDLGLAGYDRARGEAFQRRALDAVRQLPGVESAAFSNSVPLSIDQSRSSIYRMDAAPAQGRADGQSAVIYQVSPGYFRTLGMRLVAGRDVDWHDDAFARRVAVVNLALARQVLRTPNPVGERFRFGPNGPPIEIVGLVEDAKYETLTEPPMPAVFSPILQSYNTTTVVSARGSGAPPDVSSIRRAIADLDASLAIYDTKPLEQMLGLALFPSRAAAIALGAFGLLAIVLGATGLYGLVSYAVSRREREIGIRIAVGAGAGAVLRLVLARIALLVGAGAAAGAALALLMANVLASVVYTASPRDPVAFAGVGLILLIVGVVSCWAPAIRALRVSPTAALKAE